MSLAFALLCPYFTSNFRIKECRIPDIFQIGDFNFLILFSMILCLALLCLHFTSNFRIKECRIPDIFQKGWDRYEKNHK